MSVAMRIILYDMLYITLYDVLFGLLWVWVLCGLLCNECYIVRCTLCIISCMFLCSFVLRCVICYMLLCV